MALFSSRKRARVDSRAARVSLSMPKGPRERVRPDPVEDVFLSKDHAA